MDPLKRKHLFFYSSCRSEFTYLPAIAVMAHALAHRWLQPDARRRGDRRAGEPTRIVSSQAPPVPEHLADALGPERCRETTVVLDATTPPADFPLESVYQGLNLVFALGDENADARIETLIAAHSAPKSLTVVSSDRRIRQAAQRRRARSLTADEFLDLLERFQNHQAAR